MRESLPSRICFYLCFLGLLLCPSSMFRPYSYVFMGTIALVFILLTFLSFADGVKLLVLKDGDTFRTVSIVIGLVSALVILFNLLAGTLLLEILVFFLGELFFVSSALRQMRLDCRTGLVWKIKDLTSLLLLMACIVSLSLLFWVLYEVTGRYFIYILCPPLYILSKLLWLLSWVLDLAISSINWRTVKARKRVVSERENTFMKNMDFTDMIDQFSDVETKQTINPFYIVLGILFIVMVCFVVFLIMRSAKSETEKKTSGSSSGTSSSQGVSLKRPAVSFKGRSGKIRKLYRNYLEFIQNEVRCDISSSATSEDVLQMLCSEDAAVLRSLYIKARYSSYEISDDDVRKALEVYSRITNKAG